MYVFIGRTSTWIKRYVEYIRKAWRNKEVDWGPSNNISNIPNQATTSLDLKPYYGEDDTLESRTTLFQEGEDDGDMLESRTTLLQEGEDDEDTLESRRTLLQEGEHDEDIAAIEQPQQQPIHHLQLNKDQ